MKLPTIKTLSAEIADVLETKHYYRKNYRKRNGIIQDHEPQKNTGAIAKMYLEHLTNIVSLLQISPELQLHLLPTELQLIWKSGGGRIFIDEVDREVLIPYVEKISGKHFIPIMRKTA